MFERRWCRVCEFKTPHEDGKCQICILFSPVSDEETKEIVNRILEKVREEQHPEVADEDEQC